MIAITSISPNHVNKGIQQKAVDSWVKLGMKCYSFNHPTEVPSLRKEYKNIEFVETTHTMEAFYGKPYVGISAMMDWAKDQNESVFCFINSDIELSGSYLRYITKIETLVLREKNVVVANRYDYSSSKKGAKQYLHGIDVFFLNQNHLKLFPPSLFCMGQCFWDYHIPFTALKKKIEVVALQNEFAFHKKHKVQYSEAYWQKTGRQFMLEHDLNFPPEEVGRMNEVVFNLLNLTMKKVTL